MVFPCCYEITFSQGKTRSFLSNEDQNVMAEMGLVYKKPKGFSEKTGKHESFENNRVLWNLFHLLRLQLQSEDDNYAVFFSLHNYASNKRIHEGAHPNINADLMHLRQSRRFILQSRFPGQYFPTAYPEWERDTTWRKELYYYPEKEALKKFNADTAMVFDMWLEPEHAYKGKYNLVRTLVAQKNKQGSVFVHVFSKGDIKKKDWAQIEKMFYYGRTPLPYIEPSVRDSVTVHFKGRKR